MDEWIQPLHLAGTGQHLHLSLSTDGHILHLSDSIFTNPEVTSHPEKLILVTKIAVEVWLMMMVLLLKMKLKGSVYF